MVRKRRRQNTVRIDVASLVSKIKIAKELLVVYDWVSITTFIAVNWCFGFGHHIGAMFVVLLKI